MPDGGSGSLPAFAPFPLPAVFNLPVGAQVMFRYKCGVVSMFELAATVGIVMLVVFGVLSLLGRTGRG